MSNAMPEPQPGFTPEQAQFGTGVNTGGGLQALLALMVGLAQAYHQRQYQQASAQTPAGLQQLWEALQGQHFGQIPTGMHSQYPNDMPAGPPTGPVPHFRQIGQQVPIQGGSWAPDTGFMDTALNFFNPKPKPHVGGKY